MTSRFAVRSPHDVVAVVGAGISGLSAAWSARQAGRRVLVFESGERVGGVIATTRTDGGHLLELGPSSMVASDDLSWLIDGSGVAGARVGPQPGASRRYLVRDGRAHRVPASIREALATPLLSVAAKLRALAEPLVPPAPAGAREETLAALVRRRFGAGLLDAVVDPVASGVYAGDPERLSARHAFRTLHDLEREHGSVVRGALRRRRPGVAPRARAAMFSFDGGLACLPQAIARALGDAVHLRTRVTALRRDHLGWTLTAECDGRVEEHRVGAVVLAVPAHALPRIAAEPDVDTLLAPLARVPHAPLVTLALAFRREDVAHPLDGFGVLMPARERLDVLGTLFASSVFADRAPPGQVLLTAFLGGARRPALATEPMERTEQRALDVLRPLLGIRGRPTLVHGTRWTPGIPQYELGHDTVLDAAAHAEARLPGLTLAGSWRGGVSLADCVSCGRAAGQRAAAAGSRAESVGLARGMVP